MGAVGVVVIIVGILLSVALHELGHMIPAKRFGALVPEYAIGFGSPLISRMWGETRYSLRALPLGGFVRIVGMFRPAPEGTRTLNRAGKPTLAEEARRASREEIPAGSEHRAFYLLTPLQKIIVMFSGPAMNLLISIVLAAVAMVGVGFPVATPTLSEVPQTLQTSAGTVPAPAYAAGIRAGDRVTAVNGQRVGEWADIPHFLSSSPSAAASALPDPVASSAPSASGAPAASATVPGDVASPDAPVASSASPSVLPPVIVEVERGGETHTYEVHPVESVSGRLTIGIVAGHEYRSASFTQVVQAVWGSAVGTAKLVATLPMSLWKVADSLVTGAPRDSSGVVSVVGVGRIAADVTAESSASPDGWRQSTALLLSILSSLNMALFVFNLLPFPPLDGGHIVSAMYEAVRRRVAAWRGQPDPGSADTARLMPLTYTMGALFMGMTVLLVIADILRPVTLG